MKLSFNGILALVAGTDSVNFEKPARLRRFMCYFGVAWLAVGASGCVPLLVGLAAFPITAAALDATHPMVDGTASHMIWEKQEMTQARMSCDANGAPPGSDCLSYEMQGKE